MLVWALQLTGLFFILAAHEHYSVDVFIAFYLTSRLFLYYHTMADNKAALMVQKDRRLKFCFPLFSYFESNTQSKIKNEYECPSRMIRRCVDPLKLIKAKILCKKRSTRVVQELRAVV